ARSDDSTRIAVVEARTPVTRDSAWLLRSVTAAPTNGPVAPRTVTPLPSSTNAVVRTAPISTDQLRPPGPGTLTGACARAAGVPARPQITRALKVDAARARARRTPAIVTDGSAELAPK